MVQNAILDRAQRWDRLLPITRHHVECDLRVENLLWQLLKGKQVDGLLVQFVHSFLTVLRSRLKNCGYNTLHRDCFLHPQKQQREHCGSRMRYYHRPRLQFRSQHLAQLAFDPRRPKHSFRHVFQRK